MGTRRSEGLPSCLCVFCWTMPLQRRFRKLNQGAQYHEFHQICNSGSCHQIKWNIKISVQNLKKGISNTKGGADGQTWRRIKRIEHIFFSDVIQLTLTLKMTTACAQVVETSVTVNNNYVHPDDQTQPTFEMTPGFKPFTKLVMLA